MKRFWESVNFVSSRLKRETWFCSLLFNTLTAADRNLSQTSCISSVRHPPSIYLTYFTIHNFLPCISNPLPLPLSFSHLIFFPDTLPLYFHLPPSPCILSLFCISFYALPSPSLAPSISPLQPQYVRNPQKPSSSQPSPGRIDCLYFSLPSRKRQRLKATTASR